MKINNQLKGLLCTMALGLVAASAVACPACKKQQPKLLQGITHGSGPDGNLDYVIVGIAAVLVLFTLFYSIKYLIRPGETEKSHIKQFILDSD